MTTFTMEELVHRFLKITKKIQLVVDEKNWPMFNHYLIERNDVIEFIEPRKDELSEPDIQILREAWNLQNEIIKRMENFRSEIQALQLQLQKKQKAGRSYQTQLWVGNIIHKYK